MDQEPSPIPPVYPAGGHLMARSDWSLRYCLSKCRPHQELSSTLIATIEARLEKGDINYNDVAQAYQLLARIVSKYGDKYLPLFERLHREVKKYEDQNDLLQLAKQVAQERLSTIFMTGRAT